MAYSEYKFGDFARIYNSGPSDGLVGFAEGFAKGFVPAYTQAVKDRRDQEDELFRLQVKERTDQEERVRSRNAAIAADRAKAEALAATLGMPELAGQIYGSLRSGLSDTVVERTYRSAIDEGRVVFPTQATPAAAPAVGTPTDPTAPAATSEPVPGDTSSLDNQMIGSGLTETPAVTMSSQGADALDEEEFVQVADSSGNWFLNVGDRLRRNRTELIQRNVDRRVAAWEEATGRSTTSADPTTPDGLTASATEATTPPITTYDMEAQDGATAGEIQATFAILPPSAALPPISELTSQERMDAALAALGDRTDPVAQRYRDQLEALRRNNVEIPSFAGKSPQEINEMIETAPEKYGFMGEEWLNNFNTRAASYRDTVTNLPSLSGSLEDRIGIQRDIAAGRYGDINIASEWLAELNTSIERDQRIARIEPLLNPEDMIGASSADLASRRELALAQGAESGDLVVIDRAISTAQERESNGEYRIYAENVDTVREAENALSLAEMEGASEATITGLTNLRRTLEAREAQEAARNSGVAAGTPIEHVITDADGTKRVGLVTIDPDTNQTVDAAGNPVTSRPMTEPEMDRFMDIPTEAQKIGEELRQAGNGLQEALRTANTIVEIALADPATIGLEGDLSQFIAGTVRGAGSVISITNQLFTSNNAVRGRDENGDQVTYVTSGQVDAELRRQGVLREGQSIMSMTGQQLLDAFVSADITDTATRTTMLESAMVALTFRVGRIEGQSGNAMSNKDFERIMEMITSANGDIRAFLGNLHEFMSQKIASYDDAAISFERDTSTISSFKNLYGYSPVGPVRSFEQIVAGRGEERLTQAYNFFTSALPAELAVGGTAGAPAPDAPTDAGAAFESFMNNPAEQDRIRGNLSTLQSNNPDQIQRYIDAEARRLGITADQLSGMLQGGQN